MYSEILKTFWLILFQFAEKTAEPAFTVTDPLPEGTEPSTKYLPWLRDLSDRDFGKMMGPLFKDWAKDHPEDRRIYLVEITPVGRKALAALQRVADQMEKKLLVGFTEDERMLIRRALLALAG